jgi:hypothetical protein
MIKQIPKQIIEVNNMVESEKYIIMQIKGGLGNQMNQYALGLQLARSNGCQLKLDISWFKHIKDNYTRRIFYLPVFNIKARIAQDDEIIALLGKTQYKARKKLMRLAAKYLPFPRKKYLIEKNGKFSPAILNTKPNTYLEGYWHSEKYFLSSRKQLLEDFQIIKPVSTQTLEFKNAISNCTAVSIHIRRGDYVNDPNVYKKHGVCTLEYYLTSVEYIAERIDNPEFFVFSDDPVWVKKNFKIAYPMHFVDFNTEENAYEDLWLLSLCQHHIIANSTFSWWGAWLYKNEDKIVIAHSKWNNLKEKFYRDKCPVSWIKI